MTFTLMHGIFKRIKGFKCHISGLVKFCFGILMSLVVYYLFYVETPCAPHFRLFTSCPPVFSVTLITCPALKFYTRVQLSPLP